MSNNSNNSLDSGRDCTIALLFSGDNKVVIPDMQRDYCWAETKSPISGNSLVYDFVHDIIDIVRNNPIPMRMGILYAYQSPTTFIQLCDGQQRITTLYLLLGVIHKRLLSEGDAYAGNLRKMLISEFKENQDGREPRLQYAIRESTLWFTRDLVNEYFLKSDTVIDKTDWFFEEYNLDPSIKNMLETIKTIEALLKELDSKLIAEIGRYVVERVLFLYYDMGNRQYGEEQFVVINTTGVGLTNTENIKPKLMSAINQENEKERYSKIWEAEWEQFFWDNLREQDSKDYIVDGDFNEFLRWVFIIEKSGEGTLSSDSNKYTPAQKALGQGPFNLLEINDGDGLKIAETIDAYIKAYKTIVTQNLYPDWKKIQRKDGRRQPISQIDALRFLPLLTLTKEWLSSHKDYNVLDGDAKRNFERLKQFMWGRSHSDNISSSTIETVPRAIELTKKVCREYGYDIAHYAEREHDEVRFFTEGERMKYALYLKKEKDVSPDERIKYEDAIWELELLDCCKGNVTFLFDAMKKKGGNLEPKELKLSDFKLVKKLLDKTFNKPSAPFWRALLTYGDYSKWVGATPTLNSWKYSLGDNANFFREILVDKNDERRRNQLVSFIADAYDFTIDSSDIYSALDNFLNDRIKHYDRTADTFREKVIDRIIKDDSMLDQCKRGRFSLDEGNEKIYILHDDRSNQGYDLIELEE